MAGARFGTNNRRRGKVNDKSLLSSIIMSDPSLLNEINRMRHTTDTKRRRVSRKRQLTPAEKAARQRGYVRQYYWRHHAPDERAYTMTLC